MSAELLRRAAARIRATTPAVAVTANDAVLNAVAGWLEDDADWIDADDDATPNAYAAAFNVAEVILGGVS